MRETYVEVEVALLAHLAPESPHLELGLVVHVPDQLLTEAQVPLELGLLGPEQVWSLLQVGSGREGSLTVLKTVLRYWRWREAERSLVWTNLFFLSS